MMRQGEIIPAAKLEKSFTYSVSPALSLPFPMYWGRF
jgi:hypothetical protein